MKVDNLIERAEAWLSGGPSKDRPYDIIRDLLAVVSKLPRTADGAPVMRGDAVWIRRYPFGVLEVSFSGDSVFVASFPDGDWSYGVGETYSTRTAAEQARKAGD